MAGITIRRLLSLAAFAVGAVVFVVSGDGFFLVLGLFAAFLSWPSRRRSRGRGDGGAAFGWESDNGGWGGDGSGGDGGGGGGD